MVCGLLNSASPMTLSDLERSFQLGTPLENTAYITYETNYNDRLSYYFYCRFRTEVLLKVTCGQVSGVNSQTRLETSRKWYKIKT